MNLSHINRKSDRYNNKVFGGSLGIILGLYMSKGEDQEGSTAKSAEPRLQKLFNKYKMKLMLRENKIALIEMLPLAILAHKR